MVVGCAIYIIALNFVNLQCSTMHEPRPVLHFTRTQGSYCIACSLRSRLCAAFSLRFDKHKLLVHALQCALTLSAYLSMQQPDYNSGTVTVSV